MIEIECSNRQSLLAVDRRRLERAARQVLENERIAGGAVSIAIVDDDAIRELNRRYLGHDFATDVLSFPFERAESQLDGEVVLSAETAARSARNYGWSDEDELLLYLIHGVLHLVGYDDATSDLAVRMRERERWHLQRHGLTPRYDDVQPS